MLIFPVTLRNAWQHVHDSSFPILDDMRSGSLLTLELALSESLFTFYMFITSWSNIIPMTTLEDSLCHPDFSRVGEQLCGCFFRHRGENRHTEPRRQFETSLANDVLEHTQAPEDGD